MIAVGDGARTAAPRAALALLMDAGLLDAATVVDSGLRLRDASSRHSVVLVETAGAGGIALKLAPPERLMPEEEVHRIAATAPGLRAAVPVRLGGGARDGWLARELVVGPTLAAAHGRGRGFPLRLAAVQGRVVGGWHADTAGLGPGDGSPHWVLSAFEPAGPAAFAWEHPRLRAVLEDAPEAGRMADALAAARACWRPACLVHGDLKWDNCLVTEDGGLRVVDWEGAALGDPAWDLAGLLQEYLGRAEVAAAGIGGARALTALRLAGGTELGRALAALMDEYRAAAGPPGDPREPLATRAVAFTGARLVQTALEHADAGGTATAAPPTLMRLALSLLARAGEVARLLRLDAGPGGAG